MNSRICKRIMSVILAVCMIMTNAYFPFGFEADALENIAAQTDFSGAGAWNITADTTLKLPTGETLTYSTITIAEGKTLTVKGGGTLVVDTISGGNVVVNSGTILANTISCGYMNISGGTVEAGTISGISGISIINGSVKANTIKISFNVTINGGTVEIKHSTTDENAIFSKYGNIIINGGKVNITGNIIAGDAVNSGGVGGSITFSSNADIVVNGNIKAGKGGYCYSNSSSDSDSGGKGGDVIINGGLITGNITSGNGGNWTSNYRGHGGNGGDIVINDGEINGDLISGSGGSSKYSTDYDGNGGDITINGGTIKIKSGFTLGTGFWSGYLKTSTDGTAVITTSNLPPMNYFTSGVIKISGDIRVYGKQTFTSDEYLDEYDTITLYSGAELTVSGSELKVDGELKNYGSIIIEADADLTGTGTYIYNKEEISIPELKEKLIGEMITMPESIVYDGEDHKGSISIESKEAYGIKFMGMDLSNYDISLAYSKTADGEKQSTENAKNAGYYTAMLKNSSDEIIASKDFEITRKELSVSSVIATEGDGEITGIKFSGLVEGETLEFGTDYTVNDAVIEGEAAKGVINLLDTPAAQNYSVKDNGTFSCDSIEYVHEHKMTWKYDDEYHWKECSCGEKTDKEAHIKGEGVVVKEATDNSDGEITYSCTECGYVMERKTVHKFSEEWKSDETGHWKECSCGEKTEKTAHIKGEGVTVTEPTDEADGEITYSCTECGYVMERKAVHKFSEEWKSDETGHWKECSCGERDTVYPHGNDEGYTGIVTEEATPEKDGVRTFYCKECGYAYRTEAVKYEHVHAPYGDWISDKTYHWHGCKCGAEEAVFDKAEHTSDQGTVIKSATETEEGLMRYSCTVCGAVIREVTIPVISANEGKCGDNLFWAYDNGTLTISGTGTMYDYAFESKAPWYKYNTQITKIIVQNGAESIGNVAFYNLTALTEISLPNSLKSIGKNALSNCTSLTGITVPDNVKTIDFAAFSGNVKLENVKLPVNLNAISSSLFSSCYALKAVKIPEKVTSVGRMAFYKCTALTSITIPDSVTEIGVSAFCECEHLSTVVLGKKLQTIEASAFAYCYKMKDTEIPDTVTFIGNSAFYDCYLITTVTIPDGVEAIYGCTFENCKALEAISIPASVTLIEQDAFAGCGKLTHIHIPYGKNASDYSGQGGLPASEGYYFTLDESGNCPDNDCPIHSHSAAEIIIGVEIGEDNVIVKYGTAAGSSVSRTVSYSFDQVNAEIVDYMADTDIQLVIDFVNAFTAVDNDSVVLTSAQMTAIEKVLENDYKG